MIMNKSLALFNIEIRYCNFRIMRRIFLTKIWNFRTNFMCYHKIVMIKMSFTGNFYITKNTAVYYQTSCDNTSFKYVRCKT